MADQPKSPDQTVPAMAAHPATSAIEFPRKGTPLHMMTSRQKLGYAVQQGYLDRATARDIVGTRTPIAAMSDPRLRGLSTAMMLGDTNWRPKTGSTPGPSMFGGVPSTQPKQAPPEHSY